MNLLKLIDKLDLAKVDQEEFLKPAQRRDLFKKAGDFSLKAALASVPFALAVMPKIVKAQPQDVVDVLNFALTLEYLEAEYYIQGTERQGLIPEEDRNVFELFRQHETAHVEFLKQALGEAAVARPEFDFTAGGQFADVFDNYETYIALSMAFEDTGVRAYKGQAGNLQNDDDTLEAALQIHSVEARHASLVRRLRDQRFNVPQEPLKGWVRKDFSHGLPQAIYEGEDTTTQAGVDLTDMSASIETITAAFDEPLTREQVEEIVSPFIVS